MQEHAAAGGGIPLPALNDTRAPLECQEERHTHNTDYKALNQREIGPLALWIAEAEWWIVAEFACAVTVLASGMPPTAELTGIVCPRIDELCNVLNRELLPKLSPTDAAELNCLLDYSIDRWEQQGRRNGASPVVVTLALSLAEDILEFLATLRSGEQQVSL